MIVYSVPITIIYPACRGFLSQRKNYVISPSADMAVIKMFWRLYPSANASLTAACWVELR